MARKTLYLRPLAITIVSIGIILVAGAILCLIVSHPSQEDFSASVAIGCPAGALWFTDSRGLAGCCDGPLSLTRRKCLGRLICKFSESPGGPPSCAVAAAEGIAKTVASVCPPSLQYLVGPPDAPTGCCGTTLDAMGNCPGVSDSCKITMLAPPGGAGAFTNPGEIAPIDPGPVLTPGAPMGCSERRFHETLQCPTGYFKSGPTWSPTVQQNVTLCVNQTTMATCYPESEFQQLVFAGRLTGDAALPTSAAKCPAGEPAAF